MIYPAFLDVWLRKRQHRSSVAAYIGIILGALAFGLWQRSIWAALFAFAVEYGMHFEAGQRRGK
jgi:hypothetical protein